jgi:hypothetical protein
MKIKNKDKNPYGTVLADAQNDSPVMNTSFSVNQVWLTPQLINDSGKSQFPGGEYTRE